MDSTPDTAAERIVRLLSERGITFRIHEHVVSRTVADAVASLPFPLEKLLKTVVFRVKGGPWILAGIKGPDRVDYRKLATALAVKRADLVRPEAAEIETTLGVEVGGVSPLPLHDDTRILFDSSVVAMSTVFCGAGRSDRTLEIAVTDLIAVSGGQIASIVQERSDSVG